MRLSYRYKLSNAVNNIRSWSDRHQCDTELLDQVTSVVRLADAHGLSISLVRPARRDDPSSHHYNCFMWAFGLLDPEWLAGLVPGNRDVYPRSDFADHMVRRHLREIGQLEATAGDIVIYFQDGRPVHAGIWDDGLVISKWGLYSHLWKHGLCELPIEYGDEIRFYRTLPVETMREAFKRWRRHPSLGDATLPDPDPSAIAPVWCTG